jgi:hypothetical protein
VNPAIGHTKAPPVRVSGSVPEMLRWGGWWVVMVCALIRCLVASDPFPHWGIDPGRVIMPATGLTPAVSMSVDSIMLLGCGVALIGEVLRGAAMLWMPVLLWALGCVGVAVQAFVIRTGSIDDVRIGSTWVAAFAAGLTAMHVCRDERIRRVTLAVGVGIIAMLAAKGAVQVFHEHAMTLQRYRADREGFLLSQGWTPDSASAKNFERRLNQAEATGWFGLSNVYASFAATCAVALTGCAVLAWREARVHRRMPDGWAGVLTLGAAAALGALVLAGSKGGYAAAAIGMVMLAGRWILTRLRVPKVNARIAGIAAIAVMGLAISAVVVRGLVGTRVSELSLLFRWFYMQGAVRALAESPLFGTGPDGFKDAYMRLKPALSPEEVSSPHSVVWDLMARLGVFGVLWTGLWLRWVYGLGAAAVGETRGPAPESGHARAEGWLVMLAAAAPVLISTWMERAMGSPEQAAARLGGLAGWVGVSLALLLLLRTSRMGFGALAIAAMVAALHGQIEVTPLWDSSAAWMCLMLAAAGAGSHGAVTRVGRAMVAPGLLVAAAVGTAWMGVVPTTRWEVSLHAGADEMRPMAEMRARLGEIAAGRAGDTDSMPRLLQDLARLTDTQTPASAEEMDRAMARLAFKCASHAEPFLERASAIAPRDFQTNETWVRTLMEGAVAADASGQSGAAVSAAAEARRHANEFAHRCPSSSSYGLLGNVESAMYSLTKDPAHLDEAIRAWEAGARFDPYGLSLPLQAFRALVSVNRKDEASVLARRLRELDALQRLDPLKQLNDADRAVVERFAGEN